MMILMRMARSGLARSSGLLCTVVLRIVKHLLPHDGAGPARRVTDRGLGCDHCGAGSAGMWTSLGFSVRRGARDVRRVEDSA
ncbi:hypothetical protein KEM60_03110 [Austwickia sp. TVS 96-490-7B]|nr:hypothetical protein [Austwickia sp. TVS 96-490-7B]